MVNHSLFLQKNYICHCSLKYTEPGVIGCNTFAILNLTAMKRTAIILCFSLLATLTYAQWTWKNPLPQGNTLNSLCFIDATTGYSAGECGTILKTEDSGLTWTILSGGTTCDLYSVFFTDRDNGFVVGDRTIRKTVDGGLSWQDVGDGYDNVAFRDVFFPDAQTGYAAGYLGKMYKTVDAGQTWNILVTGTTNDIYSVYFTDVNTGFAVGEDGLFAKTTDGGLNWTLDTIGPWALNLYTVCFPDANTGYAAGSYGTLLKTVNGGATWSPQTSGMSSPIMDLAFPDNTTGYAAGGFGTLLKTANGGATWTMMNSDTLGFQFNAIHFTGAANGIAVGYKGKIARTGDGGATWTGTSNMNCMYNITSFSFSGSDTAYASGYCYLGNSVRTAMLKSVNGGDDWVYLPGGSATTGGRLAATNGHTVYQAGRQGRIIKTTDGGNTWNVLSTGTSYDLSSICFINADTGLATGMNGKMIKTINAGNSWYNVTTNVFYPLHGIYFTDASTGYAVGDSGIIIKTTNGGQSWLPKTSGTKLALMSVFFPDANTGYAAGGWHMTGIVLKTTNGGATWQKVFNGNKNWLQSVYCTDVNTCYVASGDDYYAGGIIKTTDGGLTWFEQPLPNTYEPLSQIFFKDATTGFVTGNAGIILKTDNGGGTVRINEIQSPVSAFSVFPNPAAGKVALTTNGTGNDEIRVNILTVTGNVVFEAKFRNLKVYEVDVSKFIRGLYLVKIQTPAGTEVKKLMIN